MAKKVQFNAHCFDPYKNYKIKIKWDGRYIAGFGKISLLKKSASIVTDGKRKFEQITIERGITCDNDFEKWANLVNLYKGDALMSLKNLKKDIQIVLLNEKGSPVTVYKVHSCWVSEFNALSDLEADANAVMIQHIILQNEGWERDTEGTAPEET